MSPSPGPRRAGPPRGPVLLVLAVVAVVVVVFVVGLLTADEGDGVGEAFGNGLSEIGRPVGNLAGWTKDTADAKGDVGALRRQVAAARAENGDLRSRERRLPKIGELLKVAQDAGLEDADPLPASVTAQDPQAWATAIGIGAGRADGVRVDQPVLGADGRAAALIGFVSRVRADSATVTLLPTLGSFVSARIPGRGGEYLTVRGTGGPTAPGLLLDFINASVKVARGMTVTTSGTSRAEADLSSKAPAGIPIGVVTRPINTGSDGQTAEIRPLVDYRQVETVLVLRKSPKP